MSRLLPFTVIGWSDAYGLIRETVVGVDALSAAKAVVDVMEPKRGLRGVQVFAGHIVPVLGDDQ